ncbi:restriction endonuclease subunit S [Trichocoleus sp. DQ-A3]|uniref:restriction endonuclease subunit S n=1 Tax=Cyanophyceae TaxID=3028117 RepID=UPI001685E5C1|nr:restriction endonuclease subunit S [Coleofasciculus sp. FACHB-125]MBD1903364.1 restriction endonuclease subunit S [Coleofasciculus sp. FACHB-125]
MRETLVKTEEFKDSAVGRIPKDWDVRPLRDLTDSPDSITYGVLKPGEYIPDGIPLLQIQDVIHGNIEPSKLHRISKKLDAQYARTRLYGGEIVMSLVGTIGKIAQIPGSMAGANLHRNLARIPISRGNSSRFVFHYLQSQTVQEAIAATTFGSTQSLLNLTDLRELLVAVPPPQEQQTIANIIDTMDEAIAHTSSLIAKLKQMKAGLLHDLLTRGLDENGELRDAIAYPEQFKDSPLGRIPKDWETGVLGDVVDPNRPIVYGILMPGYGYPGGIPVVKVKDIINGKIQTSDLLLTSPEIDNNYRRSRLEPGDLLFTIRGTVGRMAFVPEHLRGANITQDTARLAITNANPRFVRQYLEMPKPQAFIELHTIGQAVRGINLRDVRLIPLVVPPTSEQLKIIDICDTYDNRIRAEEAYRDKLKLQKQGLMHDLLTGKVRLKNA